MPELRDDRHPFEPTGYEINWKRLMETRLQEVRDGMKVDTTAGDILKEVLPHRFEQTDKDGKVMPSLPPQTCSAKEGVTGGLTLTTPTRSIYLETIGNESAGAVQVVQTLVELDPAIGAERFRPTFFFYDSDRVVDDIQDSFSFFVVNGSTIISERETYARYRGNGFTAELFRPAYQIDNPTWSREQYVLDARVRWWYRRFYEETDAGRLTTFREDAKLYHYVPEWRQRVESVALAQRTLQELTATRSWLIGIAILLFVLVVLELVG